jgi:UDP-N-acetylmuramyl pentapeptide phosphotransferase/UDP-N-acetylglucosamine-1-phosphate transferase/glycosyltransferase involved in cell wall biosynthesis
MIIETAVFAGGLAVSLGATPALIRLARGRGWVDAPCARKIHRDPMPRIGGLAIALGLAIPSILAFAMFPQMREGFGTATQSLIALAAVAGLFLIAGLVDDLWNLPSKLKLALLLTGAAIMCHYGVVIQSLKFGPSFEVQLGWLAWPVTILWIAGVTVAINFIDGLDGLAAGISTITCGVLAVLAFSRGDAASLVLSLALMGSLCGFLYYNFNPAKIFMGDCGSMLLGIMLGSLSAASTARNGRLADLALPALALGVPLLDTASTMLRRAIIQRRSIFSAERGHIHHCLIDRGMTHRNAVILIYGVTLTCAMLGLSTLRLNNFLEKIVLAAGVGVLIALFHHTGSVPIRRTLEAIFKNRQRKAAANRDRHTFEETQLRLQRVMAFDEWWNELVQAADRLGFARLHLPMLRRDGTEHVLEWTKVRPISDTHRVMQTTVALQQRRSDQSLQVEVGVLVNGSLEVAGRRLMLFQRLLDECSLEELGKREALRPEKSPRACWQRGPRTSGQPVLAGGDVPAADRKPAVPSKPKRRIAVVHDFLYCYAGAERVLEQILNVYPDADVFSLFDFLGEHERAFIQNKPVTSSFIQNLPFARTKHRAYLPLMPLAVEQLNVAPYDVVISSSYVAAKGVLTRPDQLHICYCHTPVRFAWDLQNQYLNETGLSGGVKSMLARLVLHYIRSWDVRSANGVDVFVTNSNYVGRRIAKVYRRPATTVHPPVDVDRFECVPKKEDFYLTVSRMVPYKKINLIADAFTRLGDRKLVVIGEGPQMDAIQAVAGPNVQILGFQPFDVVRDYMQRARAFVFAAEEDFGIAPVEAQACGTPVICFGRGGATESVIEGVTGTFFQKQTVESLIEAIFDFEQIPSWDHNAIRASAERFSISHFRKQFSVLVEAEWLAFARNRLAAMEAGIGLTPGVLRSRSAPKILATDDVDDDIESSPMSA